MIDVIDTSGNSLLINEREKEIRGKGIRKKKISIGIDNSITLPYILSLEKSSRRDLIAPVNFQDIKSIKIAYTQKGIKISFIQNQNNIEEKGQLGLFD